MSRTNLTDRFIKSRKPASAGERDDYPDAIVPGLALRVTDRGHRSFVLVARYPLKPKHPTRRALGDYGAITLEDARRKARHWLELIGKGIDPKIEEERQRAAALRRQASTFAALAEDFLERHMKKLAKYEAAKAVIAREFTARWGGRPAAEITLEDAAAAIRAIVDRGSPYAAHNAFDYLRSLYSWAIGTGEYGLTSSPVEQLKPSRLIGKKQVRQRVLSDEELRWVWIGADKLGYPYGPLIRLLIITGQRKNEIAEASWPEILPANWREQERKRRNVALTIPAERMKSDAAHIVPLSAEAVDVVEAVPRFKKGGFIFTTTGGKKAVNGFSKAKARLDREIARLRAEARAGEGAKIEKGDVLEPWVLHDLRRTMRTHLSALPIDDMVRELVIAHAKPGLHKVYDRHSYEAEKRRALELWTARLLAIVEPKPAGVANITDARARRSRR